MAATHLNWRRGLIRLWLALSVPWMAGSGAVFMDEIGQAYETVRSTASIETEEKACGQELMEKDRRICELENELSRQAGHNLARARDDLGAAAIWILGPPLAMGLFAALFAWIVRGFRPY